MDTSDLTFPESFDDNDRRNIKFIFSLQRSQDMLRWFSSLTQDDILYASQLMQRYAEYLTLKKYEDPTTFWDHPEKNEFFEANAVLQKFRLKKEPQ